MKRKIETFEALEVGDDEEAKRWKQSLLDDLKETEKQFEIDLKTPEFQEKLRKALCKILTDYNVYEKVIPLSLFMVSEFAMNRDVIQLIQRMFCDNMCVLNKFVNPDAKCGCNGDDIEKDHPPYQIDQCSRCGKFRFFKKMFLDPESTEYERVCRDCVVHLPDYTPKKYNMEEVEMTCIVM